MKRKLNYKFLACLLGGTVLLGAGVHFLHGYQVQRNAGTMLKQADDAEAQGKLAEAAEHLDRYLALFHDHPDALAIYGVLLANE
jgi:hypothetical protein